MTQASTTSVQPEVGAIDVSARLPLLLLLGSAILWLVAGGVLALIASIQLHTPGFLADYAWFTYGRMQAAQETALVYGWAVNAGLAVALWLLARLGGLPLRAAGLAAVGSVFWNIGLTLGLIGIFAGDMTGFAFFQLPAYVQPFLLAAYAAVAVAGVLAWTGRRTGFTFASQWYAVAGLFVFPWVFSAAQVLLLFAPVHGTLQSVVAAWFGQNLTALVLAPLALAGIYYLVPKISGRPVYHYDYAPHGFWVLLFVGGWAGGRHLIAGPVPAWVATTGIVATFLLLFHFAVVAINLGGVFTSRGSTALRFASVGLAAYLLGGLFDAVTAARDTARFTQFTFISTSQTQLLLNGAFAFMIFGAIYYLTPRLVGKPWPSALLVRVHFAAVLLGLVLSVGGLVAAGWVQAGDLEQTSTTFAAIAAETRPWLFVVTAGQALSLLGALAFAFNFVRILLVPREQPVEAIFRTPAALEVPVS